MPKLPPWKVSVIRKGKRGYDVVYEKEIPGHKLTNESAQRLVRTLLFKIDRFEFDDVVDASLMRHSGLSYLASISKVHVIRDLDRQLQGYSCGDSESMVSVTYDMPGGAADFYRREIARVSGT